MQSSFLHVETNWHARFGAVLAMYDFSEKSRGRSCPRPLLILAYKYLASTIKLSYQTDTDTKDKCYKSSFVTIYNITSGFVNIMQSLINWLF